MEKMDERRKNGQNSGKTPKKGVLTGYRVDTDAVGSVVVEALRRTQEARPRSKGEGKGNHPHILNPKP